ncbi:MAG: pilin [Pseudomonadota bacterium]
MRGTITIVAMWFLSLSVLAGETMPNTPIGRDVSEGLMISSAARAAISDIFLSSGRFPKNRVEAGMSETPSDTSYGVVSSLEIFSGVVVVTFNEAAESELSGKSLAWTPVVDEEIGLSWACTARLPEEAQHLTAPSADVLPFFCSS